MDQDFEMLHREDIDLAPAVVQRQAAWLFEPYGLTIRMTVGMYDGQRVQVGVVGDVVVWRIGDLHGDEAIEMSAD